MPRVKHTEVQTLKDAFNTGLGAGYVLNFSDRTFKLYFDEEFGVDIEHEKYRINGSSKGNRLQTFLTIEDGGTAAKALLSLWDHRAAIIARSGSQDTPGLADSYLRIVHRLQADSSAPSTDAIERSKQNETLDELVAAIQRDISVNKPQAALDRLHTYCMKKFAHLIELHGGSCDKDDPLHSRAGKYIRLLEARTQMQPISAKIMKSSISIFDEFNGIRNNKSFAHDNEIVGLNEARFIFDSVTLSLPPSLGVGLPTFLSMDCEPTRKFFEAAS